jgi:hypothetical protein
MLARRVLAENIRIGVETIGSYAIRSKRSTNYDEMLIVTASDFWYGNARKVLSSVGLSPVHT